MKCGAECPMWHFTLRMPEPICQKYGLPIPEAQDKCFAVCGTGKARKRGAGGGPAEGKKEPAMNQWSNKANPSKWPGTMRGFGPITMKIEGE